MNILYLGAFPPAFLVKRSRGKVDSFYQDSGALIKGLRMLSDVDLTVITSPDVTSWPHGPFFIKRESDKQENLTMVSSLNVSLFKQVWTIITLSIESWRYIRQKEGKVVVIIPYVVFRHVFTLRLLHRIHPNKVVQVCVVPDIFFPRKWLAKKVNLYTEHMATKFDAYILYTEKMASHLMVSKGRYEVIEGFRIVPDCKPIIGNTFKVVYAGSLNLNYGLGRLVRAMSLIDDSEIQLHLYGSGTAEAFIKEKSLQDNRIVFHGRVPNVEATDAIYSASVLINPRNANDGEYTEYSFPSKDIEYMATGIPTLLCKLPGMPVEYYNHFIDIGSGSSQEIANAIIRIKGMSIEERDRIGQDSRNFIIERMDCEKQAKKIVGLLYTFMQ